MRTVSVPTTGSRGESRHGDRLVFPVVDDLATLTWLANLAALELLRLQKMDRGMIATIRDEVDKRDRDGSGEISTKEAIAAGRLWPAGSPVPGSVSPRRVTGAAVGGTLSKTRQRVYWGAQQHRTLGAPSDRKVRRRFASRLVR